MKARDKQKLNPSMVPNHSKSDLFLFIISLKDTKLPDALSSTNTNSVSDLLYYTHCL